MTTLLTPAEIDRIRTTGVWPGVDVQSTLEMADRWMKYPLMQLRAMVPPARVPRAFDVHFDQDPLHPEAIKACGKYPWIIDPDMPYKVICPVGGEVYPTNDFDPDQVGNPDEVSEEPYIDNGWGWKNPHSPQKYWFVAYYAHWMYHKFLRAAALALGRAYVITGDCSYARQGAALLDRIAEEYPQMDYVNQSRYGTEIQPGRYHGRILNAIWETGMVADLATAYDYIYPGMENDAQLAGSLPKSIDQIRRNIEQNLLEVAARSIFTMDGRIRGNFGMHHSALTTMAIVLDNDNTDTYLDWVLHADGRSSWSYAGLITGLANLVFRDGAPNESSPGYNSLWINQFDQVARLMLRRGVNLYRQEPKLRGLYDYPLRIVMAERFSPNVGDTGGVTSSGIVGWNKSTYQTAFAQYGDVAYQNGTPLSTQSDHMSAYGMVLLRTGKGEHAAGVSLYYGPGGGHDHYARLNIELFAKGRRLSPDLGYPEYASAYHKERYGWTSHTISHNTVLVDAKRQYTKHGGRLQVFHASGRVQYADVHAEEAYAGTTELYRRAVALVDISDSDAYVLDVFRVRGGTQHDYSLHGPEGSFTSSLAFRPAPPGGSLAGDQVPVGYLYDAPQMEAVGYHGGYAHYAGSGFSFLANVQSAVANTAWDADWTMPDGQTHFRATLLPQHETPVFTADGQPPQNVPGNPKSLKYVIARNRAAADQPLATTFVAVLQPYVASPFIRSVKMVPGSPSGDEPIILEIEHTNGIDYIFQSADKREFAALDNTWQFQGCFGLVSMTPDGSLRHADLVGGGLLQLNDVRIEVEGSYTGTIVAEDYAAKKIVVCQDEHSPLMLSGHQMAGQRILFTNEKHHAEYVIESLEPLGEGQYVVQLTETNWKTGQGVLSEAGYRNVKSATPLPLGQYYAGQQLANTVTGQADRIETVSGQGESIVLSHANPGLESGSDFAIYDFGVGDRFEICSSVQVQAGAKDDSVGPVTIISNVSGQIVFGDSCSQMIRPGVSHLVLPRGSIHDVDHHCIKESSRRP